VQLAGLHPEALEPPGAFDLPAPEHVVVDMGEHHNPDDHAQDQ